MSFASDVERFAMKVRAKRQAHFVNVCAAVKFSITDGSPLTGAPGQPVDTGNLKNSWQLSFPEPHIGLISTNVIYARAIEDNIRGAGVRSSVGGFHSIALTVANFRKIVIDEAKKLSAA